MDIMELLGSSFDCECGKRHTVPTEEMHYCNNGFDAIPSLLKRFAGGGQCLLVADTRTYGVAGGEIEKIIEATGFTSTRFIIADIDGESPAADDRTKDVLMQKSSGSDLFIAVGSGVINDLVKWVAFLQQKPYIVVATAASMNGYGSANVAATVDGLKVLFHAASPKAVIATPEIIINAPHELSTAGLGDALAKPVSSADWRMNHYLFQDYYCQFSIDLLKELEPIYLYDSEKLTQGDPASFQALFTALFYSSIAMTITGTSAPASGGEHLVSHTFDMLATRDGYTHDLHGRQVGVSSILMAALYEQIMAIDHPEFKDPPPRVDESFWGSLTPIVAKEYRDKLPKMSKAAAILGQARNWDTFRATIRPNLIPAQTLKECIRKAKGAHTYSDLRYNHAPLDRGFFISVVTHANQMRSRFTVLDLAVLLGLIPERVEDLVASWLSA